MPKKKSRYTYDEAYNVALDFLEEFHLTAKQRRAYARREDIQIAIRAYLSSSFESSALINDALCRYVCELIPEISIY